MENILIFAVFFVVGFYTMIILMGFWLHLHLRRTQKELGEVLGKIVKETIEERTIVMRIEHDADHGYFAYRIEDGEFLAHGATVENLMANFAQRFPNKTGLVPNEEGSGVEHLKSSAA